MKIKILIPRQIKIATHPYEIVLKPHLRDDDKRLGSANHRIQRIEIEPDQCPSDLTVVLLHEIIHIIERAYNCDISDPDVDRIAQGMAEFLFNNLGIELDWGDIKKLE